MTSIPISPYDCPQLLCPSLDHPLHDECHIESLCLQLIKKELDLHKENIDPYWTEDMKTKELSIKSQFFDCVTFEDYFLYIIEIRQFNDLLNNYLSPLLTPRQLRAP